MLLAVDLGLRAGLAWYAADGRLASYRSTHFATMTTLKRGIPRVLDEAGPLAYVVVEGDRHLGELWTKAAEKRGARTISAQAEQWRPRLLLPRERATGHEAKETADVLARRVIEWSGARRPTQDLKHDVAEAILLGLWGVLHVGWLQEVPPLRR